jgi:signal transduction histidine kinase
VVVFAPKGRDGELAAALLREAGLQVSVCSDGSGLTKMLDAGAGALLLTEEAVAPPLTTSFGAWLTAQPAWSDLPVVLCVDADRSSEEVYALMGRLGGSRQIVVLDRPLRTNTLVSVLKTALEDRRRQYEMRDLLAQLTTVNSELRALNNELEERVRRRTRRLEARREQVQELAAALTYAEQQERARIAEVLHDHLQQLVFGIQLKVQMVRGADDDLRPALIDQAEKLAHEAMETTRTLTVELNPPVLAEDDFEAIASWLASHVEETHGLEVQVISEDACEIQSRELRALLAQSVRELLFNAAKHAGVDEARVRLERADGDFLIHVEDDGRGFDPDDVDGSDTNGGFGLYSVRERMRLFGADLAIDSVPGDGTHLTIRIPCDVAERVSLPPAVRRGLS